MREVILTSLCVIALGLLVIAQRRFYSGYFDRYGGPDGRRFPTWPWDVRPPWNWLSWLQRLDDPGVERLRRQHLLALAAFAASFLLFALAR